VTALTALAGVLIQPAARALDALQWRWSVGMIGLLVCAAGLVLGADAIRVGSLWLLAPCAAVLGCAYGLCLVSGLIEVGRLARPETLGSLTAIYYALAYLGLTTPYLLTLAAPLAGPATLLLIAAAVALAGAAVVATASRPPADTAVGDILLTLRATAAALPGGTGPGYTDPSSGEREHGARRPTNREEKRHGSDT